MNLTALDDNKKIRNHLILNKDGTEVCYIQQGILKNNQCFHKNIKQQNCFKHWWK